MRYEERWFDKLIGAVVILALFGAAYGIFSGIRWILKFL